MQVPSQYTLDKYRKIYSLHTEYDFVMIGAHSISKAEKVPIQKALLKCTSLANPDKVRKWLLYLFGRARSIEDLYLHWSVIEPFACELDLEDLAVFIDVLAREDYQHQMNKDTEILSEAILKLWSMIASTIPDLVAQYLEIIKEQQARIQIDFQPGIMLTLDNRELIEFRFKYGLACDFTKDTLLPVDTFGDNVFSLSMFYTCEQLEHFKSIATEKRFLVTKRAN